MEHKLTAVVWTLIATSLIPTLQIVSLSLAILVSITTLIIVYPKVINRFKEIIRNWKQNKK